MATYKQIQTYVKNHFGFVPKTCWIADVKNSFGLTTRVAANRHDLKNRTHHCPNEKRSFVMEAMKALGDI
jgi:hypothetical protein